MKEVTKKRATKSKARLTRKNREEHVPYRKPALRSEAFAKALINAKSCIDDRGGLQGLFNEAARKAAAVPREPFKECWPYLQTMLRLIRAHHRGEIRPGSRRCAVMDCCCSQLPGRSIRFYSGQNAVSWLYR